MRAAEDGAGVSRGQLPLADASSTPQGHTVLGFRSRCRARFTPGNTLLPAAPARRPRHGTLAGSSPRAAFLLSAVPDSGPRPHECRSATHTRPRRDDSGEHAGNDLPDEHSRAGRGLSPAVDTEVETREGTGRDAE